MNIPAQFSPDELISQRLLRADDVAVALNIPRSWLTRTYQRERLRIPHHHVNRLVRFKLPEVLAWYVRHAEKGPAGA
jgi:hypothetical protein